jgi:Cdc6-like AAA superfamily ATPase
MFNSGKPALFEVENAFQPAKEISDVRRFAGRAKAVGAVFLGLMAEGANIAIVGNRGIGKTSLARQVQNFANGDNDLLEKLKLEYSHAFDFQVFYLTCGTSTTSKDELLSRLITSDQCLGEWLYDIPKTKKLIHNISPKLSAQIFGIGGEVSTQHSIEHSHETVGVPHSVDTIFENIVTSLVDQNLTKDGIIFIIDEFDQIKDPSGIASFLKAIATNTKKVKFCIVGVANDIQELMQEHESSDRLFAGTIVALEPMSKEELGEIIEIAEINIDRYITFSEDARNQLVSIVQGHPYLVHLIGKFAFRAAYMASQRVIDSEDVNAVLRSIAENASDPVLEGRYRKAVASSALRESVLKALANAVDDRSEVWTTSAYKTALDAGVENPSQYVGQLVTEEYGAEIEKVRERYYRFKDSLFVSYVRARPPMLGILQDS